MASEARTKPTTASGVFNVSGTPPASAENTARVNSNLIN